MDWNLGTNELTDCLQSSLHRWMTPAAAPQWNHSRAAGRFAIRLSMNRVYVDERIASQTDSLFYNILPPRCHGVEERNKEGNHRTSVEHKHFFSVISSSVPATFYLLLRTWWPFITSYRLWLLLSRGKYIGIGEKETTLQLLIWNQIWKLSPWQKDFDEAAAGKDHKMESYPCKVSGTDYSTETGINGAPQ